MYYQQAREITNFDLCTGSFCIFWMFAAKVPSYKRVKCSSRKIWTKNWRTTHFPNNYIPTQKQYYKYSIEAVSNFEYILSTTIEVGFKAQNEYFWSIRNFYWELHVAKQTDFWSVNEIFVHARGVGLKVSLFLGWDVKVIACVLGQDNIGVCHWKNCIRPRENT